MVAHMEKQSWSSDCGEPCEEEHKQSPMRLWMTAIQNSRQACPTGFNVGGHDSPPTPIHLRETNPTKGTRH